jgi:hypothetical protein
MPPLGIIGSEIYVRDGISAEREILYTEPVLILLKT